MPLVLSVFALVFLMRDAQVLALRDGVGMAARFAVYGALQLAAIGLMTAFGGTGPGVSRAWTDRRFALACVLIQVAELGIAYALRKFAAGRFSWFGWMLPSPVFLIALFGLSFALQKGLRLSSGEAIQTATLAWLSLVCAAAILLSRVGEDGEDMTFTGDFALLTGCTALMFVPAGFF